MAWESKNNLPLAYRTREVGSPVDVHGPREDGLYEVWYTTRAECGDSWHGSYTADQVAMMFPKPSGVAGDLTMLARIIRCGIAGAGQAEEDWIFQCLKDSPHTGGVRNG